MEIVNHIFTVYNSTSSTHADIPVYDLMLGRVHVNVFDM